MTVIGPDAHFTGNINIESDLNIEGFYEGEIVSSSNVTVKESGILKGKVFCNNLTVYGKAECNSNCTDAFTIIPGGQYSGDVAAKNLFMQPDSLFDGSIKMLK